MRNKMYQPGVSQRIISIICLFFFIAVAAPSFGADSDLKPRVKKSVDNAMHWLRASQQKNGSWSDNVGVTSLVVMAYMKSHREYNEDDDPFVRDGILFILSHVKEDGSIYKDPPASYNTALALLALANTKNPKYADIIKKAQDYLIKSQSDEEEGYKPSDKYFGGIGYGGDERPDLANLQYALEALKESGLPKDSPVWEKAIKFIDRCQNRSESNDQAWAKDDGGFIYSPKLTFVPDYVSYGSMTFAGIKGLIFANIAKDDPRLKTSFDWVQKNYNLNENTNYGVKALYFYYDTMSKALSLYGEKYITTQDGVKHDWYSELAGKLMSLQDKEGFWVNTKDTEFWEGNKDLATAHALLALETEYNKL
ncbi:MAG: terpene cyclase/mutase family protein [Nitrospirae bacterium]|nr:terpene cyclase/mutase family protein [Nitrospirota bacterium]